MVVWTIFDIKPGDSYPDRIEGSMSELLALFRERGARATFFVLGDVAVRFPQIVEAILADGHEIGAHGHNHRRLTEMDADKFREDLRDCLAALRKAGATNVVSFRAPFFSLAPQNEDALQVLADEGIKIDSSVFPMRNGHHGSNRVPDGPYRLGGLLEVPITLPRISGCALPISGGFYARLFPTWLSSWSVRRQLACGTSPVFYLHPWELDADQPRLSVPRFLQFRHYLRLDRMRGVLETLLGNHQWRPVSDLLEENASLGSLNGNDHD